MKRRIKKLKLTSQTGEQSKAQEMSKVKGGHPLCKPYCKGLGALRMYGEFASQTRCQVI
jgi:hypothetical protein